MPAGPGLAGQAGVAVPAPLLACVPDLPGYRVDVVFTMRGNNPSSKIILQDMLVLAVDTTAQRDPNQQTILGSTVTISR